MATHATLKFFLGIRKFSIHVHESLEKNLEVAWKRNGIVFLRNNVKFHLVNVVVHKSFGGITLIKNLAKQTRVINHINPRPTCTCLGQRRYHYKCWITIVPDPPKKSNYFEKYAHKYALWGQTCYDGIENQDETSVDSGGYYWCPCPVGILVVTFSKLIPSIYQHLGC